MTRPSGPPALPGRDLERRRCLSSGETAAKRGLVLHPGARSRARAL